MPKVSTVPTTHAPLLGSVPQREERTEFKGDQFIFAFARGSYSVENGEIVPALSEIAASDGINGCSRIENSRGETVGLSTGRLRDSQERGGRILIPQNIDAPEHPSYVMKSGPGAYHSRWTTVHPHTDRVTFDHAGFRAWRKGLMERGILPRPTLGDLSLLLSRAQRSAEASQRYLARIPETMQTDADRRRTKVTVEAVAVVESAIEALLAASNALPTEPAEVLS